MNADTMADARNRLPREPYPGLRPFLDFEASPRVALKCRCVPCARSVETNRQQTSVGAHHGSGPRVVGVI